jgi:hypothetical protein
METLGFVIGRAEFSVGFRFGLLALVIGLVTGLIARARWNHRTVPVQGLLLAAAATAGLQQTVGLPVGLSLGLVALAGAGLLGELHGGGPLTMVAAVPGAWLVVWHSGLVPDNRLRLLVGGAIVVSGWLVAGFDDRWRGRGLGPVLLAVSVVGVYFTVPDTEQALVALGAALPLAFLGWPWPLAALGRAGAYAATGLLLWVIAAGGVGRGSAVVGGLACLGLLAMEPVSRLVDPGRESALERLPDGRSGTVAISLLQLGLVYVAARVAGLRPTVAGAATITLAEFAMATMLGLGATAAGRRLAARRTVTRTQAWHDP